MLNIAGTWRGTYTYDLEGERISPPSVNFTLILQQGWLRRITGTFQDDPDLGLPLQASVQGRVKGAGLFFRKIPAEFYTLGEQGLRPVTGYVEQAFGEQVRGNPRPPHIHYRGRLDRGSDLVDGAWHIPSYLLQLRSTRGCLVIPETRGTWHMRRIAA